jgi:hypothetical protein
MTVTLSELIRQRAEMNIVPPAVEVGRETWEFILDVVESGSREKWPIGYREMIEEGNFMGIKIRPADVPEGKLWPLESA